jgi:hypothetical protein
MSHPGRLEAPGPCLTFISVAATAPPCPALPTCPLGGQKSASAMGHLSAPHDVMTSFGFLLLGGHMDRS